MLPHKHFLIAGGLAAIAAFFFQTSLFEGVVWVVIAGIVSVLIDIDAVVAVNVSKQLREEFSNPLDMFRKYEGLLEELKGTGIINILMVTHVILSAAALIVTFVYFEAYLVSVLIGVFSHLLVDVYEMIK